MMRFYKVLSFLLVGFFAVWGGVQAAEHPQVKITDVKIGTGPVAAPGARVKVHYTGWTLDGKKFDSSRDRGVPFEFSLGAGEVIQGWDIGVQGMRVGGQRELMIPPELAYGDRGYPGAIPPRATLKFAIELVNVLGTGYTNVDSQQSAELMKRGVPVIDVRRQDEWDQTGVIKGAKLITAFDKTGGFSPTFMKNLQAVVGKNDEFILICQNGPRSTYLAKMLSDGKGYTRIYNVQRGMTQWAKDGYPVVKP